MVTGPMHKAAINAGVNFGVQEFNFFFGWILPPLPGPFRKEDGDSVTGHAGSSTP